MTPMVFAAFANDDSKSLSLIKERDTLRKVFNDKSKVELKILDNAGFDFIADTIIQEHLQERIVVFHYAGHADGKNIRLIDGNAQVEGLARLLKTLPNLQLVFLNGCDTYEQVEQIQQAGIKTAIITTLKPVDDQVAISFASNFYFAFYKLNPVDESFESAVTRIIAKPDGLTQNYFVRLDRGIGLDDLGAINTNIEHSKTVYILTAFEKEHLKRTLLFEVDYEEPLAAELNYKPNRLLIKSLGDSIINGNNINKTFKESKEYKDLEISYTNYCNKEDNRNFSYLVSDVLELLPSLLGFHVSLLNANGNDWDGKTKEKRIDLLKRQVITYNSLIQVLTFTLLSSFWYELDKNKKLNISPSQWEVIRSFLSSSETNNQDINYPALLVTIREIFEANGLDPFITEYQDLKNFFETEDIFFETHLHMQGIKSAISNGQIMKLQVGWLCYNTEKMLSVIFSKSGFVIRYKLTTIKNIEITKSRLKAPSYYITRNILDRTTVYDDDIAEFDSYTDSRSVILAKGTDPTTFFKFLTLSPFIIDENALRGKNMTKLFIYSHSEDDCYVYRWADDPGTTLKISNYTYPYRDSEGKEIPEMVLINKRMKNIKDELESFKSFIKPSSN
jgi:hypothetical protein